MHMLHPVPGFTGYYATSTGEIWSTWRPGSSRHHHSPLLLQCTTTKSGHKTIRARREDGTAMHVGCHCLVLLTFCGPCPEGYECRHLDGKPGHNDISNLKWGTRQENMNDRDAHGKTARGTRNGKSKLTHQAVLQVAGLIRKGWPHQVIADATGVTRHNVTSIAQGSTWSHISGITQGPKRPRLTPERVDEILTAIKSGLPNATIARMLKVSTRTITMIKSQSSQ